MRITRNATPQLERATLQARWRACRLAWAALGSLLLAACGGGSSSGAGNTTTTNGGITVSPRRAALTTSQTQQFSATLADSTSTSVTWGVDGISGGNTTVGTISSSGVYTPPSAAGTHTISAISTVDTSQSGSSSVAVTNLAGIYTRHTNSARTGLNLQEYALTPGVISSSGNFGKLFQCQLDEALYAQPLYVANLSIAGGVHNVVFLATENDSVYAIDADSSACTVYWQTSFIGTINGSTVVPVPPSVPYQSTLPAAFDILNNIGITGTPVISAAQNAIYVVAKTQETDQSGNVTYHDRLHALNLASGSEQANSPVDISAAVINNSGTTITFTSLTQNQRPGLLLADYANGSGIYIAWSSYGDNGTYNGWVIGYDAVTLAQIAAWNDTPNGTLGGIWLGGGGIAVDSSGALYLSTGNGTFDDTSDIIPPMAPNNDFGESFVKLDPSSLAVTDFYAPSQTAAWTAQDEDLSSSGVSVLPDGIGPSGTPNLLVGSDKQGHLWLIDRDLMSRFSPSADNTVQYLTMPNIAACPLNCTFSTPAYYNGTVYIGMVANPLMAFTLTGGIFSQSNGIATASTQSAQSYGYTGVTPVVSGSPSGNAIVWVLDASNNGTASNSVQTTLGAAILRAYDATNLGTTLYSSAALSADEAGDAVKFAEPVVANGKVYVGGYKTLTVYGLLP
jgi:hypothetical protein